MIIGPQTPPPLSVDMIVFYWERSIDPWKCPPFGPGTTQEGWLGIDYAENPVHFVADGTVIDEPMGVYLIQMGLCGHLCAYPPGSESLILNHQKIIHEKK